MEKMKILILAFILFAGCVLALSLSSQKAGPEKNYIDSFPLNIGDWKAEKIPINDEDLRILGTRNVLLADYRKSPAQNKIVQLLIVLSSTDRSSFHPPEYCFIGSGAQLLKKDSYQVKVGADREEIEMNRLLFKMEMNLEMLIFYWYDTGKSATRSYYSQQAKLIPKILAGKRPFGAMIRLQVEVKNRDLDQANKTVEEFLLNAYPVITRFIKNASEKK